jgi:hypothetical protein
MSFKYCRPIPNFTIQFIVKATERVMVKQTVYVQRTGGKKSV